MTSVIEAEEYLSERTGCYDYRSVRYNAAASALWAAGLEDDQTVYDIGAGMTEFDFCLRAEWGFRGRYIPIDASIDGTDIEEWVPKRHANHAVALEILEHLKNPGWLVTRLQLSVDHIVVSVPNPRTVDVLGIDRTHVTIVTKEMLEYWGFSVTEKTFYGGKFSNGEPDSLFAEWTSNRRYSKP